jgi:quercetin dioxygenase-like cupin family protein
MAQQAVVVRASEGERYGPSPLFKHGSISGAPFDFLIVDLAYGEGPPLHVHAAQHDTFYVLDGVLTVQIGDERIEMTTGDYASVPPGVPHAFDNTRKDQPVVKVLNIMTPGGLDQFFVMLKEQGGRGAFDTVAAKCGMKIVGPPLVPANKDAAAIRE